MPAIGSELRRYQTQRINVFSWGWLCGWHPAPQEREIMNWLVVLVAWAIIAVFILKSRGDDWRAWLFVGVITAILIFAATSGW